MSYRAASRPEIAGVKADLSRQLTKDRHRALIVTNQGPSEINIQRPRIRLNLGVSLSLDIIYNGYDFQVTAVNGDVTVNNTMPRVGQILPPSCVIGFTINTRRQFVTFDVSHPEISL